jgi:pilus assembly protein CpaC
VKPLAGPVQLPTDAYIEPNRSEVFLGGRLEGSPPQPASAQPAPAASQPGFELK